MVSCKTIEKNEESSGAIKIALLKEVVFEF